MTEQTPPGTSGDPQPVMRDLDSCVGRTIVSTVYAYPNEIMFRFDDDSCLRLSASIEPYEGGPELDSLNKPPSAGYLVSLGLIDEAECQRRSDLEQAYRVEQTRQARERQYRQLHAEFGDQAHVSQRQSTPVEQARPQAGPPTEAEEPAQSPATAQEP